ncbi:MAG: S8 family serine peptidase [Bacteroidia bacterium]|nr:S8 family serine peptidase [Bacteroidia bacterium]MCF8427265.1 S8 family serine peptidase [Bacteroidia bacterium]MCF8445975.1 S8 family serine peptidase [Bacteroidia bacterium]
MRILLLLLLGLFSGNAVSAQYSLIYLTDKALSEPIYLTAKNELRRKRNCIDLDQKDYQVSRQYLHTLSQYPIQIIGTSRWLNAVCIKSSQLQLLEIQKLPFVKKIEAYQHNCSVLLSNNEIGSNQILSSATQLRMLELERLHAMGYTGKGIDIAVFDNGFTSLDYLEPYADLRNENRIRATKNFVDLTKTVYQMGTDGDHGSRVLSVLAAKIPNQFEGTAYDANFYLAVTEDMTQEGVLEEWNWLMAAEWADSLGVDIISSSLGYFANFTYGTDYTYEQMDGKTTLIARAANIAASKGILVINAAGNEGESDWRHIISPADADSCLAVGSVDALEKYSSFSSIGPTYDGRTKPDIMAMGGLTITFLPQGFLKTGNGTSFACPMMSGFAACLWQVDTTLKNMELFQLIKQSGNNATYPNNYVGWGIPKADKVYFQLTQKHLPESKYENEEIKIFPNPSKGKFVISFLNESNELSAEYFLFNPMGEIIQQENLILKPGFQYYSLDFSYLNLAQGLYYLKLIGLNQSLIQENKLLILE